MANDGSDLRPVAQGMGPTWSPDGSEVAFFAYRPNESQIYVVASDGSNARQLTEGHWNHEAPAWSPDGSRIAFCGNREGRYHLHVMNADGSGLQRLTDDEDYERCPVWSPDGTRIAYIRSIHPATLWVLEVATGAKRPITTERPDALYPDWSPDGHHLAFQMSTPQGNEIHIVDASGSQEQRLTDGEMPAFCPVLPIPD